MFWFLKIELQTALPLLQILWSCPSITLPPLLHYIIYGKILKTPKLSLIVKFPKDLKIRLFRYEFREGRGGQAPPLPRLPTPWKGYRLYLERSCKTDMSFLGLGTRVPQLKGQVLCLVACFQKCLYLFACFLMLKVDNAVVQWGIGWWCHLWKFLC